MEINSLRSICQKALTDFLLPCLCKPKCAWQNLLVSLYLRSSAQKQSKLWPQTWVQSFQLLPYQWPPQWMPTGRMTCLCILKIATCVSNRRYHSGHRTVPHGGFENVSYHYRNGSYLHLSLKTRLMSAYYKWTHSQVTNNAFLTIIVISLLHMLRSGTLLTYIRFSAQRIPPWARTRNTVEKPPGKKNDKPMKPPNLLLIF